MMDFPPTILIAEGKSPLRDTLAHYVRAEGYLVLSATNGASAWQIAQQQALTLVILNQELPEVDGFVLCRLLRDTPETATLPIFMLSTSHDETDIALGLEVGADDFLSLPCGWGELLARVRALLRRSGCLCCDVLSKQWIQRMGAVDLLTVGDLSVDLENQRVTRGFQQLVLKPKTFDLLVYLMRNRGILLTREQLLKDVWGRNRDALKEQEKRTVDVHVRWLRELLEDDPVHSRYIQTVRGIGYRFLERTDRIDIPHFKEAEAELLLLSSTLQ